jgi:hypothetical protein
LTGLFTPTLRLGVTGIAQAGKTVFITVLIRNLVSGGRLPFFGAFAEGRILAADLEPQPDDQVPHFDYEAHLAALGRDPPHWPESTRRISEVRVTIAFKPESRLRRALGVKRLNLDIVDYPGEWLLDLAMLDQTFAAWSADAMRLAGEASRRTAAAPWLDFIAALDPLAPEDEQTAITGARLFTKYLCAARAAEPLSTLGPGRFLMAGDLEGSPLLTFFPLGVAAGEIPPRWSLAAMMARRYDSYVAHVVRPFFRDHFARLDRQIVLVDALSALNGGAGAVAELERALAAVLKAFRPGANSWLASLKGRRIDRLLFAATKADHIHHSSHDRLEAILRVLTDRASARATSAGSKVAVMALASLRATRETEARVGKDLLPCIVGVPLPGETLAGTCFDGRKEAAVFPGDLPADPNAALDLGLEGQAKRAANGAAFIRFCPPRLAPPTQGGETVPLPHIRLDRAFDFLIGDWLE